MSTNVMTRPLRTMLEVYQSLPEGTPVQLVNNHLIMSPAPTFGHQRILGEIFYVLQQFVKKRRLGEIVVAPVDVYLGKENILQPDILFISNERKPLIREDGLHGAPDLIIEILSPGTAEYDLKEKKEIYERYGVREYWVVDPATGSAQGFYLKDGRFSELSTADRKLDSYLLNHVFEF